MAKDTSSNAFRRIDVDQFNEDNFKDEDGPAVPDNRGGPSSSEVESLIQSGRNADALKSVLSSAPIGNKNQTEKVLLCIEYNGYWIKHYLKATTALAFINFIILYLGCRFSIGAKGFVINQDKSNRRMCQTIR